jgi:hypothetical protein
MPSLTLKIDPNSDLHKKLLARIASRISLAKEAHSDRHEAWRRAEDTTLAYLPEREDDILRRQKRDRGEPKYTTIQIPYSYATLMSAHTYWTSTFFARSPIHQYSGRHGESEMQVQALEALIAYQVEVGEFMAPYYIWLYDGGKYGHGVLGHYWEQEVIHYGAILEYEDPNTGEMSILQTTEEVMGYEGNKVYNLSPYDFMHDPRVTIGNFQKGEFCVSRRRMGWSDILRREKAGYFHNLDRIREHLGNDQGASEGSSQLKRPDFSKSILKDDEKNEHPAGAAFWEFYVELIPSEWGVGKTDFPQKWCFTVTEDMGLIVGASPLGYIHGKFPFDIIEPEIEGYGIYNRGIPEVLEGVQNTMDWLINSHFFNVRASLNNQFIIDPSKLVVKDVQNGEPGFIWRLRPEAYGEDIRKFFHQIPVTDVTRGHFTELNNMISIGERIFGVNDQIMGSLNTGGRKTATEVRTSSGFGTNRLKTIAEYMSHTAFAPHSQKLVQSSQQYYDMSGKLKIVGDLAQDAGPAFTNVSPEMIAGFYSFVPIDGSLPVDRMAQANLWKEIFGGLRNMPPQIAQGYDWAKMFGWMASLAGLKNIHQFKVQVVPDAQIASQAQAGNIIPMRPGGSPVAPGNSASNQAGLPQLNQGV